MEAFAGQRVRPGQPGEEGQGQRGHAEQREGAVDRTQPGVREDIRRVPVENPFNNLYELRR